MNKNMKAMLVLGIALLMTIGMVFAMVSMSMQVAELKQITLAQQATLTRQQAALTQLAAAVEHMSAKPAVAVKSTKAAKAVVVAKSIKAAKPVVVAKSIKAAKPVVVAKSIKATKPVVVAKSIKAAKPVVVVKFIPVKSVKPIVLAMNQPSLLTSATAQPSPLASATAQPSPLVTAQPSPLASATAQPSPLALATVQPGPLVTAQPSPLASATAQPSPLASATAQPSPLVTAQPSPLASATAQPSPLASATAQPSPLVTAQPSPLASATAQPKVSEQKTPNPDFYLVLDRGVRSVTTAGKTQEGNAFSLLRSSRLGFRGDQDIGHNRTIGFVAETKVSDARLDFGDRELTVSFSDQKFGKVEFGHRYTPTFYNTVYTDVCWEEGQCGASKVDGKLGQFTPFSRVDEGITWFSPKTRGGLYVQAQTSLAAATKSTGGLIGYEHLRWNVTFATDRVTLPNSDDYSTSNIGVSFKLPNGFIRGHIATESTEGFKRITYNLGIRSMLNKREEVLANFSYADRFGKGTDKSDTEQFNIGWIHHMSPTLNFYVLGSALNNGPTANVALAGGPGNVPAGASSTGVVTGLVWHVH